MLRDPDLALQAAELAHALSDPPSANLLTLLANIQFERGETALAVDLIEQAIAIEPTAGRQRQLARYRERLASTAEGSHRGH